MRADIAPGGTFPDGELPDHESVPWTSFGAREAWEAGDVSAFHGWSPERATAARSV